MTTLLDTRQPRLMLVLLCLLLWTPGFFTLPPGDRDESRFAQASKQMIETGDLVRIMNGEEARNRKPIGIHWLQVPMAEIAGALELNRTNPVWPYRVPSLLGGMAAVLACFAAGARLVGPRAGLLGAGMLAASVVLTGETHIAKTDAALLGATTVAMAVLARAWAGGIGAREAALFWLALGLGILLKGPIAPMVAGLAMLSLLAVERRAAWWRELRWAWGVPLMLAVVLPWFVAIGVATEGRFFADAVGGDLGRKLTSGDESHWGPPGLHLVLAPLLLFPATAALPGGLRFAWGARAVPQVRFLLAWLVPAWLVFEAAPTKLPHYTLPLYPALCLLLAAALVGLPNAAPGALRWQGAGKALAAGAAGLLAAAAVAAPPFLHLSPWLGVPGLLGALATGWFALRGTGAPAAARAAMGAVFLYAGVLGWELPRLVPLWIAPRVAAMLPKGRLGAVGFAEPSLMFLVGTETLWLRADDALPALLGGGIDTLLVGDRDLPAVMAEAARRGVALRTSGQVTGFNYARGRWVTLTLLSRQAAPARATN